MSKSSSDISKPPSRLSIDSRSSKGSTKAGSTSPEKTQIKKFVNKFLDFDKSRSNSVEKKTPEKIAENLDKIPQKRLEIRLQDIRAQSDLKDDKNLAEGQRSDSTGRTTSQNKLENLKNDSKINSEPSPQPGSKRPRSKSPDTRIKKVKDDPPRPLPHIYIQSDGKTVSFVDYAEKSKADKTKSPTTSLKVVIKPINKPISPITIIKQGGLRIKRHESSLSVEKSFIEENGEKVVEKNQEKVVEKNAENVKELGEF
jgi:hypothetical protein